MGSVKATTFLADGAASVESEGHKYPPRGIFGGSDGTTAKLTYRPKNGGDIALPSKVPYHRFGEGDKVISYRACGGGYGDPFVREPADVLDDVLDGYVSVEDARRDYGVVIEGKAVDGAATQGLRAAR